ncbi:copper chaperone PCu(A)C [Microbulbifer echini]|uniref:Copper chaperone PCu(A)C n=1 Tax=Microbulbifer echini TaxID=1529067 RepID=A0ABV4NPS4_9GAMM|nr:copper chaperone PCu(A)C [uncultured Microbulbifer sp.]
MNKKTIRTGIFAGVLLLTLNAFALTQPLSVTGYARETPPGAPMSAAYLSLHNTGEQLLQLTAVELPGIDGGSVNLHTTGLEDGISRMRPLDKLVIAPGEQLQMTPGGVHLMIHGVRLHAGVSLPLRLLFSDGTSLQVQVPVMGLKAVEKDRHRHHRSAG